MWLVRAIKSTVKARMTHAFVGLMAGVSVRFVLLFTEHKPPIYPVTKAIRYRLAL
jgi:hypothetical protein